MERYAVYYDNGIGGWVRVQSHKIATRGRFKGQIIPTPAVYTKAEAEEIAKELEADGHKTKIKEVNRI